MIETCPGLLSHEACDVAGAFQEFTADVGPRLEQVGFAVPSEMSEGEGFKCAWDRLGEDAREVAMRAAVDYSGRVVEPYLRRVRVQKEKEKVAMGPR